MAHLVHVRQMWERQNWIHLVVGSDPLDGSPPKHTAAVFVPACSQLSNTHTHTRLADALFVFSCPLVLLYISPLSSRLGVEVLSPDELSFSDLF